jgi:hypothetical protein
MVFNPPNPLDVKMHIQSQKNELLFEAALIHEVTHAVVGTYINEAVPLWANEGIAVYMESAPERLRQHKEFARIMNLRMGDPSRIVYDLYGLKSPYKKEQKINVKSDWLSGIRYYGHPEKIRMVLETTKAQLSEFSASPADDGLLIYVGNIPETLSKDKAKPLVAQNQTPLKPEQKAISKDRAPQLTARAKTDELAWLNRIDFSSEEAGKSAVIIGTTRPVDYELTRISDKRLQLELLDTNLPEYRDRALITTRFQSAVDRITPTQPSQTKDTVIVIDLREAVPYLVKQTDNIIKVDFAASTIPPKPYEDGKIPAWKKVMADPATGYSATSGGKSENIMAASKALEKRAFASGEPKPIKFDMS